MTRPLALCALAIAVGAPTVALSQSTALSTYALFASEGVKVATGGSITDGDVGSHTTVTMSRAVAVAAAAQVAADRLRVGVDTVVAGSVFVNEVSGPGTVSGP